MATWVLMVHAQFAAQLALAHQADGLSQPEIHNKHSVLLVQHYTHVLPQAVLLTPKGILVPIYL